MKLNSPTALAALILSSSMAVAQPRWDNHGHVHRIFPGHQHAPSFVIDNAAATESLIPQVIVYVDKEGTPFKTITEGLRILPSSVAAKIGHHTSAPSVVAHVTTTLQPSTPKPTEKIDLVASPETAATAAAGAGLHLDLSNNLDNGNQEVNAVRPPKPKKGTPSPPPQPSPSSASIKDGTSIKDSASLKEDTSSLPGVAYAPFNADGTCKSASQIYSDFQEIDSQYSLVRIYGVVCDQVARVIPAAQSIGVKLFLGIFDLDNLDDQIATLVSAVNANGGFTSGIVDTISVGNELVNNNQAHPQQVMDAVAAARASLRSAGYDGPVVTVDTFIAVLKNPILCDASDYCAMNIHAFFDPNTSADRAGAFVAQQVANVREVLADRNQRVVVTESGWPWQGNANGQAVPGRENQAAAVKSIMQAFEGMETDLVLFTAFNDPWKKAEANTFYAEQFWGMH
ncbi:glycoside hydrolase superfamily [Bombardia bombarda]|uniref:Glycoside hydrolase superfamily n=1 Tax=Bombardia bombarda TaxID=252184 RepID=A0AA40C5U4_9PEZI|nr:glycoside hydrolase superfamily [Bombardia bombarda]